MKKYLISILFSFLFILSSLAEHQNEPYEPNNWDKFLVNGSYNYYKFKSELVEDKDVKKEIKNLRVILAFLDIQKNMEDNSILILLV